MGLPLPIGGDGKGEGPKAPDAGKPADKDKPAAQNEPTKPAASEEPKPSSAWMGKMPAAGISRTANIQVTRLRLGNAQVSSGL